MKLIELDEKKFRKFALSHPQNNFHQTIEWGLVKENNGWKKYIIGLVDKEEIKAGCLLLEKKTPVGNIFYSPRGFLIDYMDKKLLKTFTEEIKKFGKEHKAIFIKIDPYLRNKERDVDGNIVKDGFDNGKAVDNLINLGYKHNGFNLYFENLQPRWMFDLDLENKNIEEVLANMESKTRQLINKNIRMNIVTRELNDSNLMEFKKIMAHTSERRGFIDRPFSYYKEMYDVLSKKNMIKFMVTELHTNEYLDKLEEEKLNEENDIKDKEQKIKDKAKINIDKTNKAIELSKENIKRLNEKIAHMEEIKNKHGEVITLGGILYILYGDEVLSLFGGSYDEFNEFYPPYTNNYEMIKYAIENGYKRYNFYGITGDFNPKNEYYGLYDFKRGFKGHVSELIGEFDLIINKPKMIIYNVSIKLYSLLKKIKSKLKG